jgi:hypothetical protein
MEAPIKGPKEMVKLPHDAFGEHIAERLRSMNPQMVPICEKLIGDMLFLATIGNLNATSRVVTDATNEVSNTIMTAFLDATNYQPLE